MAAPPFRAAPSGLSLERDGDLSVLGNALAAPPFGSARLPRRVQA